jgi:hypothetical protein
VFSSTIIKLKNVRTSPFHSHISGQLFLLINLSTRPWASTISTGWTFVAALFWWIPGQRKRLANVDCQRSLTCGRGYHRHRGGWRSSVCCSFDKLFIDGATLAIGDNMWKRSRWNIYLSLRYPRRLRSIIHKQNTFLSYTFRTNFAFRYLITD